MEKFESEEIVLAEVVVVSLLLYWNVLIAVVVAVNVVVVFAIGDEIAAVVAASSYAVKQKPDYKMIGGTYVGRDAVKQQPVYPAAVPNNTQPQPVEAVVH